MASHTVKVSEHHSVLEPPRKVSPASKIPRCVGCIYQTLAKYVALQHDPYPPLSAPALPSLHLSYVRGGSHAQV